MSSAAPRVVFFKKDLIAYSETFIVEQARHLTRYRPAFLAFNRVASGEHLLGDLPRALLEAPPVLGWLRRQALRAGWVAPRWGRQLAAFSPAIVHAQFGFSGPPALPLARAAGVPLVVTFRGSDITSRPSPAYHRARRRVYQEAAAVLGVAQHLCDKLVADGCPPEKVGFLTTGIDVRKFDVPRLPAARPTVLFVGRLVEKKGLSDLLAAVPAVVQAVPEVSFELIGTGELQPAVDALAARFPGHVLVRGRQPHTEVIAALQRAAVHCVPSRPAASGDSEGMPNVHLEAQAAGVPPVAFDADGVREAVLHGETGVLVPTGDVPALAAALIALLRDEPRRRALGEAGRERVRRHFDVRRQCAQLEALYDRLLSAAGR